MNGENIRREWFDKDYYQVLGVPKNASASDIRMAYRKLAQKHHPDANRGDKDAEERFKEVSAAFDVLGDPEKRAEYDRVRDMASSGFAGFGTPGGGRSGGRVRVEGFPFGAEDLGDLGDLFGGLFGGGGGRGRRPSRGADLQTEARISFDEAMRGVTVPLRIQGPAPCGTCGGSGARPGTAQTVCPECRGSGSIAVDQGLFSMSRPCSRCGGSGRVVEDPCPTCDGSGSVMKTREFSVRIPPGVKDGQRIKLEARGESGPAGSKAGDLYVVVRVEPHRVFGRRGSDLTLELPVSFVEAALGANVKVPTLNGPVTLKIPPGTSPGRTFRIRGKGAPKPKKGSPGDLLVTVRLDVPSKLSSEEKDLLRRLGEAQSESPRKGLDVEAS